jgi:hypothetical protein
VLGEERYELSFYELAKNDEIIIDSIQINKKGMKSGNIPSFRVKDYYMDYCGGKSLGEVMLEILKIIEPMVDKPIEFDLSVFEAYNSAKSNLIIRPISYTNNKKLLKEHIYKKHGDIALVLYMLMSRNEQGMGSAKVHKKIVLDWDVDVDYIFLAALENTARLFRPFILPMEFTFRGQEYFEQVPHRNRFFMDAMTPFELLPSDMDCYYLSVDAGINGAAAAFYPGVLERLGSIFEDDLYLTFTCVREAIVHPVSKIPVNAVKEAASGNPYVESLEFLSGRVYKYYRSDKALRML